MRDAKLCIAGVLLLVLVFAGTSSHAEDYSSTGFILRDPVITVEGGRSTSASFEYFSSTGQIAIGESTTTNFISRGGFLYFPQATSPVVSATAGDGQVSLTWTASIATLTNITDYQLGTGTISGGPYTYVSVGNVLSSTKTGLTNGTAYYFKIRAYAGTELLVTSAEATATPVAASPSPSPTPSPSPAPSGGGGGGGAGYSQAATNVNFSGRAYPKSTITLLKDAQVAATTVAGQDANFKITLSGLTGGNYIFSVYSEDGKGYRSSSLTFPVSVTTGSTTTVSGIFIAPTIAVDKSEVKRGDNIAIFGQSVPLSEITISVNSEEEFFEKVAADATGVYLLNFDTVPLAFGQHYTKSKAAKQGEISSFSKTISFAVGDRTIFAESPKKCPGRADLNTDCKVNLVDFSIAAYWYKRVLSLSFKQTELEKLNGDGTITLVDFSIMAFYWTG